MKKLENLLKSSENSNLERLVKRAQNMDSLTAAVRAKLPVELAENLVAANVRDNEELVVICTSSAWAARLRFESEALLDSANEAGFQAMTCVVKVRR